MSRIDEALTQRALVSGDNGAVAVVQLPPPSSAEPLDRYPRQADERSSVLSPSLAERASLPAEAAAESVSLSDRCDGAYNGKLVVSRDVPALAIEQYRRLAAALHEAQAAHGLKSLIVTSALPLDGKTLTAINLALTLSESYGRRVLLIDADLRRPSLHKAFGLVNHVG